MNIEIVGRNEHLTEEMREQIEQRFEKLARQVPEDTPCEVTVAEQRNPANPDHYLVEATLRLKGATIHATSKDREFGPAVGHVVEELQRQVHKRIEKARAGRHAGAETIRHPEAAEAGEPA